MEGGAATVRNSSPLRKGLYPEHEKKLLQGSKLDLCILERNTHTSILGRKYLRQKLKVGKRVTDFPSGSDDKASAYNAGDLGLIPGSGRSPGEGNGNHSSNLAWKIPWTEEPGRLKPMRPPKSQTQLSNFTSLQELLAIS